MLSENVQDYLKVIYKLSRIPEAAAMVSTTLIAERMEVSAASATNMIKKLAEVSPDFRVSGGGTNPEIRLLIDPSDPAGDLRTSLEVMTSVGEVLARALQPLHHDHRRLLHLTHHLLPI